MQLDSLEVKADLTVRLRRIEGQVRGVQRMVEESRDCGEILQQMAAARSAMRQASLVLTRAYAARCLTEPANGNADALLDTLIGALGKME